MIPWRLQGNDPLVSLDEAPVVARNLIAGLTWHQGLTPSIPVPATAASPAAGLDIPATVEPMTEVLF